MAGTEDRRELSFSHVPVLFEACMEALRIRPDGCYVDATLGGAGHASGILERLGPGGRLLGFDKDLEALETARRRLGPLAAERAVELRTVHADFRSLDQALQESSWGPIDGILADLGVSSHQLDSAPRGFSFRQSGPLDMRMDQSRGQTAADLVNSWSAEDLERCFRDYGEERYARLVARQIVDRRRLRPFAETLDLAKVIAEALPAKARREKHPAKRCFQALRIAVNDELGALEALLDAIPRHMAAGGRVAIISFHSLEDRLIKRRFRQWERPCTCPPNLPCVCGKRPLGHSPERRGQVARAEEQMRNSRAHSARLRIFEWETSGCTETT